MAAVSLAGATCPVAVLSHHKKKNLLQLQSVGHKVFLCSNKPGKHPECQGQGQELELREVAEGGGGVGGRTVKNHG